MQDLEIVVKPEHIEFEPHNLIVPWCVHDRYLAMCLKLAERDFAEKSLHSIIEGFPSRKHNGKIPVYYLPDRNLLLSTSNKSASSSMRIMLNRMTKDTGELVITTEDSYKLLELIKDRDPEIWHVYRDPFMRMVSYFYYIGKQAFENFGVRWLWEGVDMYHGRDVHRRLQFAYLPGHFNGENINERIKMHLDQKVDKRVAYSHDVPSDVWAYPFLGDFVPHKKVKFFWLHEKDVTNRTNAIELMYQKLGIAYQSKTDYIVNRFDNQPNIKDIPLHHIQKIWQAQQPEREFLSKLRWENGPIQFHGLT